MFKNQDEVILILITSTVLILLLGTIVVIALLIQKKRKMQYQKQLSDMQVHYESTLLQTKLKIMEETFGAISQNLHDNIGSNISTAMLLLYRDEHITETEYEINRQESLGILDKVVDDLKNISHSLNPDYLEKIGLNEAIKHRIDQLSKTKKYKIDFQFNEAPRRLNRQKQLILYYVFQEAINNINTHASAGIITLRLMYDTAKMLLQVRDDGKGIDPGKHHTHGAGLMNMKNHAEIIGGTLTIKSENRKGTHISLTVPDPYEE